MKKIVTFILAKSIGQYINLLHLLHPKKALHISYALFTNPRVGKTQKESLPAILQNTVKETFQHNEHHFQTYTWEGNDTKILLVHGSESNSAR